MNRIYVILWIGNKTDYEACGYKKLNASKDPSFIIRTQRSGGNPVI